MSINLPKPNQQNLPKTSRAERRKKFGKFKDTARKCFGKPTVCVGICLKDCLNRDIKCDECYRFSELRLKPVEK
jgi:hypothetical protein